MATKDGTQPNGRKKSVKLNYFYLDGEMNGKIIPLLHKSLHISRGADTITTWCYPLHKRIAYTYSDVRKRKQPAYTTQDVSKMLNRHRVVIENAILAGNIQQPQFTYGLDENKRKFKYMWSEKDILDAHAYLSTVHRGRPRKDGLITPAPLPTVRELRAMIRQETVLYVKNDAGEFIPAWRAENFN